MARLSCELEIHTLNSLGDEVIQKIKNFNPAITNTETIRHFATELNSQLTNNTYSYTLIKSEENIG